MTLCKSTSDKMKETVIFRLLVTVFTLLRQKNIIYKLTIY